MDDYYFGLPSDIEEHDRLKADGRTADAEALRESIVNRQRSSSCTKVVEILSARSATLSGTRRPPGKTRRSMGGASLNPKSSALSIICSAPA